MEEVRMKPATSKQYVHMGMFDLAKGLGMLIIFGEHWLLISGVFQSSNDSFLRAFIHNMIIPMFFLTSGYGFTHRKKTTALWKQIRVMLRVYLFTSFSVLIFTLVFGFLYMHTAAEYLVRLAQTALGYFLGLSYDLAINGHYYAFSVGTVWFLVANVLCMLFMEYVVCRLSLKKQIALVIVVEAWGCIIGSFINLPYCLVQAMLGLGYYYLGWQLKQTGYFAAMSQRKGMVLLACMALWVVGSFNGIFNFATSTMHIAPLAVVCACGAGFVVTHLSVLLSVYSSPVLAGISWMGRNTIYLIALDAVLNRLVKWAELDLPALAFFAIAICFVVVGYRVIRLVGKSSFYQDTVDKLETWARKQ